MRLTADTQPLSLGAFNMNEFHFLRPECLWLVLPLLVVLLVWYRQRLFRGRWSEYCDDELLPHILEDGPEGQPRWPLALFAVTALLCIVSLAGPTWQKLPVPVFRNESALIIVLDLSRSMDAADIKPSRLQRARFKVADILRRRQDGLTALVVYGADAFTVAPLTDDTATIMNQLSALETRIIPEQGSATSIALGKAESLLQQAGANDASILLITDGLDQSASQIAAQLKGKGHRLFVLGVGRPDGAPIPERRGGFVKDRSGNIIVSRLPEDSLRSLAAGGGGFYRRLSADNRDIEAFIEAVDRVAEAGTETDNRSEIDQWIDAGPWLLVLVLPFAALAFRQGYLALLPFLFLPVPESAVALEWNDFWSTRDQLGYQAYQQGDLEKAGKLFENPDWKAASDYASGNYGPSLEALQGSESPGSAYNRGNALARLGRFPEALNEYKKALEENPENEDAQFNRELIEKLMKEQQSSGKDSNQKDEKSGTDEDETGEKSEPGAEGKDLKEQESAQEQPAEPSEAQSKSTRQANEQPNDTESADKEAGEGSEQREEADAAEQEPASESDRNRDESRPPGKQEQIEIENEQAKEQWLRRIPDDPGGLLRRKFKYQYGKRHPGRRSVQDAW